MDELEQRAKSHYYTLNKFRTNLGGPTMRYGPKRKIFLVDGHLSNTLRTGPILELCRSMLGQHITSVCLNHNVCCAPHRDSRNAGESYICYFGEFSGGALCVEDGRRYEGIRKWHGPFDGSALLHWNEAHEGDKYSVVAFVGKCKDESSDSSRNSTTTG